MEIDRKKYNWEQLYPDTDASILENLAENKIIRYFIDNQWICLSKYEGKIYAFKDKCPHAGGSFFRGTCENGKVVCPIHHYGFDLKNGQGHGLYLENYPVILHENNYYIGFKKKFLGF